MQCAQHSRFSPYLMGIALNTQDQRPRTLLYLKK